MAEWLASVFTNDCGQILCECAFLSAKLLADSSAIKNVTFKTLKANKQKGSSD